MALYQKKFFVAALISFILLSLKTTSISAINLIPGKGTERTDFEAFQASHQYATTEVVTSTPEFHSTNKHVTEYQLDKRILEEEDYKVDISGYSIRYGMCYNVKMYSDTMVNNAYADTVLAVKSFIMYRLCPSDSCDTCNQNYGEYVADIEEYLDAMTKYSEEQFEDMCENCECNNNDDCSCQQQCDAYENQEENGYVDATDYVQCQKVEYESDDDNDGDDDGNIVLYVGPRCANSGTRIKIGVFQDENCWVPYDDIDVGTLLGNKLSYHLLRSTYSGSSCVSCMEDNDNEEEGDANDADNVKEMCENIYDESAKCETKHDFDNGLVEVNGYENQLANEFDVCTFIDSLIWDSYDEDGEIVIGEVQDVVMRESTHLQVLTMYTQFLVIFTLAGYIYFLTREIHIGFPHLDLACHGGEYS